MVEVKLTTHRDMELYVKQEIEKLGLTNKFKKIVRKAVMDGVNMGTKMQRDGHVNVEVS